MTFEKCIQKDIYKYNNYEEVKGWSCEKRRKNLQGINPDIICRLSMEGMEEQMREDPKYFEQKSRYHPKFQED